MVGRPKKPDRLRGAEAQISVRRVCGPQWEKVRGALDYTERLRRLAINDMGGVEDCSDAGLDPKTAALVRLAALVAVGGAVPSYGAEADAAVSAGATVAEIVEVLVRLVPIVGLPRVVAAAPAMAMALGYDTEDALEVEYGDELD